MPRDCLDPSDLTPGADRVDDMERTILAYVTTCPGACDTLDGICDWWIPRQQLFQARAKVLAALERLERRGAVQSRIGVDGQSRFAVPQAQASSSAPKP